MTVIYGIKNCDTVKRAIKWFEENDLTYAFHDVRVDGLDEKTVSDWAAAIPVDELVNKRSTTWRQLDDATKSGLNAGTVVPLILQHETLFKQPLIAINGCYHVGWSDAVRTRILEVSRLR